jgi:hypothetical protein
VHFKIGDTRPLHTTQVAKYSKDATENDEEQTKM